MSKQFTDSDKEELHSLFEQFKKKATKLLNDSSKIQDTLKRAFDKAIDNEGPIAEVFNDLKLLLSLVKDYVKGAYRRSLWFNYCSGGRYIVFFVANRFHPRFYSRYWND